MPTIKKKVEMNLPQLIQYVWDKGIKNEKFARTNTNSFQYVWIDKNSNVELDDDMCIGEYDIFTVEIEGSITENTEFKLMIEIIDGSPNCLWENSSIEDWKDEDSKEFHAYIDGEFKLIWKNGRLVE